MRNLVVCCDGTWNTPDHLDWGLPAPTNVTKIFNAVDDVDATGQEQLKYYHPGVGAEGSWWRRMLAGGIGAGSVKTSRAPTSGLLTITKHRTTGSICSDLAVGHTRFAASAD